MNKNLNIEIIYSFLDLPSQVQKDFLTQFENMVHPDREALYFGLKIVPYKELLDEFDNFFGPNLIDQIESKYVQKLAKDIIVNGLRYPPICQEGIHRTLAHLYLKRDMPRFELIPKSDLCIQCLDNYVFNCFVEWP